MKSNLYIDKYRPNLQATQDAFKKELQNVRTGRASTAVLEDVMVESYGMMQPLKNVASLSIPENTSIAIAPWDKTMLKEIEIALNKANLGMSIVNTGEKIIAKMPMMTEENRKQMVKVIGQKSEDARIAIRQIRDDIKSEIIAAEKAKEMNEDDKYQNLSLLDEYIDEQNMMIDKMRDQKEVEVMTI